MMKKKITIIIGLIIIAASAAYFANASGLNLFGGNSYQDNGDALVSNITLAQNNYNSGSKSFVDSTSGNNGTSVNTAAFVPDNYGKSGGAMSFNGSTDVVTESTSALGTSATFASWGYATSFTDRMLWNRPTETFSSYYDLIFYSGLVLLNTGDGAGNPFKYSGGANILATDISLNQWHHYVVVVDAAQNKGLLYIDGVYWGSANYKNPTGVAARTLSIGGAASYRWQGAISELKIYNRALSATEVQSLYNSSKPKISMNSLQTGLIGYWPLNGDNYNASTGRVTDKTPYENNGTNNGATLTTDRNGQVNGAMSFNGTSNYITISYPNPIKQTSVVAWFKRSGVPAGGYHIITGGGNIEISIPDATGAIRTGVITATQGRQVFNSGSGLNDGKWHQVAMTYDGTNLRSFIDGALTATNPVSGNLSGSAGEIGRYLSNAYVANGSISDVRIYNRVLSTDEINTLYNSYRPKVVSDSLQKGLILDAPLTSAWVKSEVAGSQLMTDRTPYSNDLQNNGATVGADATSFDGVGAYYVRTNNNILLNSSQTYSIWVKPNTVSGWLKGVLTTHAYAVTSNIGINQIDTKFNISIGYTDGTREYSLKPSVYTIVPNIWTHVVLLYDDSDNSVSFYINGAFDSKWNLTKPVKFIAEKVLVGQWSNNYLNAYKFDGLVSSAKVYNRALSATEIQSLYGKGR